MDLFDKESGSLYLTYDRFHNILHASREGEGTDGFLRHIHDDVSLILQEGHDPNVWFTYFEFPDKRDIPNLALKDMSLFFEKTHYTKTDSSYLITGHQIPLFLENNSYPDLAIGYLTKTYLYSYLTDTITETLYTDLENVAIEKIQTMEYTARKLLKKTTTATSQGNLRTVEYEYNSDNPSYQWPGLKHILNLLTKKTTTENNQKRQEEYGYGYGEKCIPYLSEVTTTINNDPSQTTYKVKSAGYNGKPVEIEEQGVTSLLLWGYGGQRIIAKIVNASLERLYELPGFGSFDYEDNWESAYAKIESIRQQLPSSQFFVYTYDNRLKLQSIANPNGVTEFFNYDFLGRLIERYYTERTENGWQKRLLNRYDYNYSL